VLHNGEPLYREIRIENILKDEDGEEVELKPGVVVDVTLATDVKDTVKKEDKKSHGDGFNYFE
jgi:hypothetical protein